MEKKLEHPDTVIIEKNNFYNRDITEEMIYKYYDSVSTKIIEELGDDKIMVVIKVDGHVIKKHFDGLKTISNKEDFNKIINTGRTVEVHRIFGDEEPFAVVDIDPRKEVSFDKVKEVTEDITFEFRKFSDLKSIQVYFSGRRGFHVYAFFNKKRKVNDTKKELKKILEEYIEKKKDDKIKLSLPKNEDEIRLDITIFHPGGSIRLPYSIHKETGLASIPVKNIRTFNPSEAKINKFLKLSYKIIKSDTSEKAIGFDFDNTIFVLTDKDDPYSGYVNPEIARLMRHVKNSGYKVIIFTSRIIDRPDDIDFILNICDEYDLPCDEVTYEKKPEMVIFYDDRSINPNLGLSLLAKLKTRGTPPPGVPKSQFPRETKNYLRYRQFPPSKCKPGSFWIKELKNGDKLVMCELKDSGETAVQSKMIRKRKKKQDGEKETK